MLPLGSLLVPPPARQGLFRPPLVSGRLSKATMRLPGASADATILSAVLFPILAAAVGNIDCTHVVVDHTRFDLEKLGGARSVVHRVDEGPSFINTTYTIDICKPLGKAKDVNPDDQCPNGTRCRSPPLSSISRFLVACLANERQYVRFSTRLAKTATVTCYERCSPLLASCARKVAET